jgi:hypothetical protein
VTALKPIEDRNVQGCLSDRYPLNEKCSQPECSDPVQSAHHCFPRSQVKVDSWFVKMNVEGEYLVLPHVTGLCGSGTTGHHGDVEEHRAWIKLEDGEFVWYERVDANDGPGEGNFGDDWFVFGGDWWHRVGNLNPQPAHEGKPKRSKHKGEARRKRRTISLRVPDDAGEDGAGVLQDAVDTLEAKLRGDKKPRPMYYTLLDGVSYAHLNMDETDV